MSSNYEEDDPKNPQPAFRISQAAEADNGASAIRSLRRFMRPRAVAAEHCDLCSAALTEDHEHLIEPQTRQLSCACQPCAILFGGQGEMKYRRVPRRVRYLSGFRLTDAQWESLLIPIQLAFFFHSSPQAKTLALYPSPAGATESLLALDAWDEIVKENPVLNEMEPDTMALLVNRVGQTREYYLAPIDECYKLVGIIRTQWRGFSGGTEAWAEIGKFFAALKEKAKGR